jgi:capsular polysaccharide biosynthesis protein
MGRPKAVSKRLSSISLTAGDVYRALWRHRVFITVLTAVFVAATWYATEQQTQTYEASALVRAQERGRKAGDAAAALQASVTLAQSYAKMIDSGALDGQTRELLAGKVRNLSGVEVSADPVQDLDLLTIRARSNNARSATIVANATPSALKAFIHNSGSQSEHAVTVDTTPSSPVSRHLALNVALALMLGLIFNGALALVLELVRDRLPEPDELGRAVGHPVLATIPTMRLHGAAPVASGGGTTQAFDSYGNEEASPTSGSRLGSEP